MTFLRKHNIISQQFGIFLGWRKNEIDSYSLFLSEIGDCMRARKFQTMGSITHGVLGDVISETSVVFVSFSRTLSLEVYAWILKDAKVLAPCEPKQLSEGVGRNMIFRQLSNACWATSARMHCDVNIPPVCHASPGPTWSVQSIQLFRQW